MQQKEIGSQSQHFLHSRISKDNNQSQLDEEITSLTEEITKMEKNFVLMQKSYIDTLKKLQMQIVQKDKQFERLSGQVIQIKSLATQHKNKTEQLYKNNHKKQKTEVIQPRVKSKSPVLTTRSNKFVSNNAENANTKSISPKNSNKKVSPAQSQKTLYKPTFAKKVTPIGEPISLKNINGLEKSINKNPSPANSYQKSRKLINNIDQSQSMRLSKKQVSPTNQSLKEKPKLRFK